MRIVGEVHFFAGKQAVGLIDGVAVGVIDISQYLAADGIGRARQAVGVVVGVCLILDDRSALRNFLGLAVVTFVGVVGLCRIRAADGVT
ncbi:MAG: hypothetical protein QMD11_05695 [Smithella sp.]|nr:hypothetical protein [Smithella sp.]